MKRTLAKLLTIVLVVSMFAGCSGKTGSSSEESKSAASVQGSESAPEQQTKPADTFFGIEPLPERTTVRIALFTGSHHGNGFIVADKKGWFDELNIDVEYVPFVNGPIMMEAMNDWDVGTTGAPGCINGMVGRDLKVLALSSADTLLQLYVREESPIWQSGKGHIEGHPDIYGTPEDWKGTTWLLPIGTTMQYTLASTLECMGLTTDDVTMVNMDATSAYNAFKAGEGDGCGIWSSVAIAARDAGYKMPADIISTGELMSTGFFANPQYLASNRDITKTVMELYLETATWGYQPENREECAQILLEHCEGEGLKTSFADCLYTYELCSQFSIEEQAQMAKTPIDDPQGIYNDMNELQYSIINIFDFFESIGNYDADARVKILGNDLIDTSLLLELEADRAVRNS